MTDHDPKRDDVVVRDEPDRQRYAAAIDGVVVAHTDYSIIEDDAIILSHTEVSDELKGQSIASLIAKHALDDARARNLRVVPLCRFVAGYIERHPAYEDLVVGGIEAWSSDRERPG